MFFRRTAVLLTMFSALAFATVSAKGQGIITGSVTGLVEDPTGAVVAQPSSDLYIGTSSTFCFFAHAMHSAPHALR